MKHRLFGLLFILVVIVWHCWTTSFCEMVGGGGGGERRRTERRGGGSSGEIGEWVNGQGQGLLTIR